MGCMDGKYTVCILVRSWFCPIFTAKRPYSDTLVYVCGYIGGNALRLDYHKAISIFVSFIDKIRKKTKKCKIAVDAETIIRYNKIKGK